MTRLRRWPGASRPARARSVFSKLRSAPGGRKPAQLQRHPAVHGGPQRERGRGRVGVRAQRLALHRPLDELAQRARARCRPRCAPPRPPAAPSPRRTSSRTRAGRQRAAPVGQAEPDDVVEAVLARAAPPTAAGPGVRNASSNSAVSSPALPPNSEYTAVVEVSQSRARVRRLSAARPAGGQQLRARSSRRPRSTSSWTLGRAIGRDYATAPGRLTPRAGVAGPGARRELRPAAGPRPRRAARPAGPARAACGGAEVGRVRHRDHDLQVGLELRLGAGRADHQPLARAAQHQHVRRPGARRSSRAAGRSRSRCDGGVPGGRLQPQRHPLGAVHAVRDGQLVEPVEQAPAGRLAARRPGRRPAPPRRCRPCPAPRPGRRSSRAPPRSRRPGPARRGRST